MCVIIHLDKLSIFTKHRVGIFHFSSSNHANSS